MIHPDELGRRLTSRQIAEWQAYDLVQARDEDRADWRAAAAAAAVITFTNPAGVRVTARALLDDFRPPKIVIDRSSPPAAMEAHGAYVWRKLTAAVKTATAEG